MATVEALKEKKDIELMKMVLKERNIRHYLLFIVGCNKNPRGRFLWIDKHNIQ